MSLFYNNFQKLRQENADERAKVSEENKYTLGKMIDYLSSFKMSYLDLEILKKDLIGIARESDIEQINMIEKLGIPEKEFCDTLVAEANHYSTLEILFPTIRKFFFVLWLLYTTAFLLGGCPKYYSINFTDLLFTLALTIYANDEVGVFHKKAFVTPVILRKRITVLLLFLLWVILCFSKASLKLILFSGNGWVIFATLLLLSVLSFFVNNYYWDSRFNNYNWK